MAKIRREYAGGAVSTTTTAVLAASNGGSVNLGITANTGWPFGPNKFYVVIEPGTANEEKMLVSRASSGDTSVVVASNSDRGLDGTTAITHASGSTIYPVFTSVDADEANELAAMWESKGDLVSYGTATFGRLAVGTNNHVLQADSSTATGLKWGLVGTDNLAADAVTAAKIAAGAVGLSELAAAVTERTVPAGTVVATVSNTADSGWLLLNGQTVASADSTYPSLWAVVPASWKSGTSLVLPDMADRVVAGAGATTLGATGGANTATLATTNLPSHTHTMNHGHSHTISATQASHTHTVSPTGTVSGTVGDNTLDIVYNPQAYNSTYISGLDSNNDGVIDGTTNGSGMALQWTSSHGHTWSGTVSISTATSTSATPAITVSGGVTNHTGDTGATGNGTAFSIRSSHLALRFQIKAH